MSNATEVPTSKIADAQKLLCQPLFDAAEALASFEENKVHQAAMFAKLMVAEPDAYTKDEDIAEAIRWVTWVQYQAVLLQFFMAGIMNVRRKGDDWEYRLIGDEALVIERMKASGIARDPSAVIPTA